MLPPSLVDASEKLVSAHGLTPRSPATFAATPSRADESYESSASTSGRCCSLSRRMANGLAPLSASRVRKVRRKA
jgi:hypothetical protein